MEMVVASARETDDGSLVVLRGADEVAEYAEKLRGEVDTFLDSVAAA
jgi:methyl-accepting chemotaxis protein